MKGLAITGLVAKECVCLPTVVQGLLSNTGDVWQADLWLSALCADHPQKLYQLPVMKKIMLAVSAVDYNVLQAWVVHTTGCAVALYCL